MKVTFSLLLISFLAFGIVAFSPKAKESHKNNVSATISEEAPIKWLTVEEMEIAQKKEKRKVFIDVYTDWCSWCKVMDKKTFSDPKVAAYVNKNYYAVKLNAEQFDNIIFKDRVYKFVSGRKSHELAIEFLNGEMSYPTTVYLDEKMRVIAKVPGFLPAEQFVKVLQYFEDGVYKNKEISLEAYLSKTN